MKGGAHPSPFAALSFPYSKNTCRLVIYYTQSIKEEGEVYDLIYSLAVEAGFYDDEIGWLALSRS